MSKQKNKPFKIKKKEFIKLLKQSLKDPEWLNNNIDSFFEQLENTKVAENKKGKDLIVLENISKKFHNFKTNEVLMLFDDLNLKIKQNDIIALVGANGAGKSTLVDIIVGYQQPTIGKVIYNFNYKNAPSEKMGIAYQKNAFLFSLTVWDYISFTHGLYRSNITLEQLLVFIYSFGIEKVIESKVSSLSGGQQQRLNAMLSLFHNPQFIFFDELCNNLDVIIKEKIINFIKRYIKTRKITGVLISHDAIEVESLANRIVILKDHTVFLDAKLKDAVKQFSGIHQLLEKGIR